MAMETSPTVVIKVKYGDVLRRFSSSFVNGELNLNMDGLRRKILSLFNFPSDTELMLTYIDEDGDLVSLVDDDDLHDAVKQVLNPFRITVKIKEKTGQQFAVPTGSSAPLRMPQIQPIMQDTNNGFSELLRAVPEPLREIFMKLSADVTSRASSSAPGITEFVDYFSKLGLSYLTQLSNSRSRMETAVQSAVPGNTVATEPKVLAAPSNVIAELSSKNCVVALKDDEVKFPTVAGGGMNNPSPSSAAEAVPLNCQNTDVTQPRHPSLLDPAQLHPKSGLHSHRAHEEEIIRNVVEHLLKSHQSLIQAPCPGKESPFSGTAVGYTPAAPPHPAYKAVPNRTGINLNNGSQYKVFHGGVTCDGCGIHPIVGSIFKSIVKVNYDLCNTCFEKMGNDGDYIRMDFPEYQMGRPTLVYRGTKVKSVATNLDSRFVKDVTIIDGTVIAPSTPFTKIWRMRNNGRLGWVRGTKLVWIGGDKLSNTLSVELEIPVDGVWPNQELDVTVDFVAPEHPGRYLSYWRMETLTGQKFGQRVWVLIQVDTSIKEAPPKSIRNLNLNLPPVNGGSIGSGFLDAGPDPMLEAEKAESDNSKRRVELVQPNTEKKLNFPTNYSLLVGNAASSSAPVSSATVSYPIIDLSDVLPSVHSVTPSPPRHLIQSDVLEEKEVDLNKERPRMNEYNSEQAVDDICGVVEEWDSELEDMGFNDREKNKMLLKKKMDLVAAQMRLSRFNP